MVVILKSKGVYSNKVFENEMIARNFVRMNNPKRKFRKDSKPDELVCCYSGGVFKFIEVELYDNKDGVVFDFSDSNT